MRGRVAGIEADGVAAVRALDAAQVGNHLLERLLPADRLPAIGRAPHRLAQPVGIVVQVLQGHRLGADMAAAERVLPVAADGDDLVAAVVDLDPAHRLAEVARAMVDLDVVAGHGRFLQ